MTLYEVAKEYVSKGWSVLPLQPFDKKPLMKWGEDGLNVRNRRLTDGELHSFFDSGVNNIGLAMGTLSGLVAIDVDSPDYFDEFDKKYPTGLVAETPSGGRHYFYRYSKADLQNIVGKLRPHVDIRTHGGYVVAYPSKLSNGSYHWLTKNDPSDLPDTIRQEILSQANTVISTNVNAEDGHELWLRILRVGFTDGQHNVEVRDAARYLFRQGMNESAIVNTLTLLNSQDKTPQPQSQLEATIRSGVNYEKQRLASKPVLTGGVVLKPFARPFREVASELEGNTGRWLINDWMPVGALIMMAAPPENYKTWLSFELAVQVALGDKAKPFLGQYVGNKEPQKVLLVQQEDGRDKIYERLMTIAAGKWAGQGTITIGDTEYTEGQIYGADAIGDNILWHTEAELSFDNPDSLTRLEETIAREHIKLVIIDPVYTLGNSDNYFAELARKMVILKAMQAKYDVSFLLLHHTKKGDAKGREAVYGSQLLNGAMEGLWLLREIDGERQIEKRGKAYTGEKYTKRIEFMINDAEGIYESTVQDITTIANEDGEIQKLTDRQSILLKLVQDKPGMIASRYEEFVAFKVQYVLKQLIDQKLIKKDGKEYFPIDEA